MSEAGFSGFPFHAGSGGDTAAFSIGDGGREGGGDRKVKKFKHMKRSFAETIVAPVNLGGNDVEMDKDADWFDKAVEVESDDEGGDPDEDGIPVVRISKELRTDLVQAWRNALIVKYLGKHVAFPLFKQRITRIWNIKGRLEMIDVGSGCYVVRFDTVDDCKHVLFDGPWKLFDNYIVAQRWRPDFDPTSSKLEKMAVWVRLPRLPVEYFRDDILKLILEPVGTPLKLDILTARVERGQFARAAVEIDLSKPLSRW